jgi:tellurite resistance protein TerC
LFIVLLIVETTDLVFALDSIPAVFGVTHDPFIVYTSNVFAILGLRSLYFALAGIMGMFHYLKIGLAAILVFVGVKMVISDIFHVPIGIALGVIAGVLTLSVVASLVWPEKPEELEQREEREPPI